MGKTVVFANQKGGVGKTTSAVNLGSYIADLGKRVLLVDFDPQGNMSSSLGHKSEAAGIYELMMGHTQFDNVVRTSKVERLDLLPSNIHLSGANVELVEAKDREYFLKNALEKIKNRYDYIFIDCPPSLGILTVNGLCAADEVIIPLQCEYFALEGLAQLLSTIKAVQTSLNVKLGIGGIIFTMYDSRTRLANEVVREVTSYFGEKVFQTIIPRNVRLSEAPSHSEPISRYDENCLGALSYKKLAEEVVARV